MTSQEQDKTDAPVLEQACKFESTSRNNMVRDQKSVR